MSDHLARLRTEFAVLTEQNGWSAVQTPRNMALALTASVGSAAGRLQFVADGDPAPREDAELHAALADALVFLLTTGDALGVDVVALAADRVASGVAGEPTG